MVNAFLCSLCSTKSSRFIFVCFVLLFFLFFGFFCYFDCVVNTSFFTLLTGGEMSPGGPHKVGGGVHSDVFSDG